MAGRDADPVSRGHAHNRGEGVSGGGDSADRLADDRPRTSVSEPPLDFCVLGPGHCQTPRPALGLGLQPPSPSCGRVG